MKVSVNILTWNTYKTTTMAMEVLEDDLKDIDHEIIIVDQGSIDGCEDLAVINNKVNMGTSKGKNQGIKFSLEGPAQYIFLLDGDIVPVPNSINMLIDCLDKNKDIQAVGMYPNQFTKSLDTAEPFCARLTRPILHSAACIFYGIYRRGVFDKVMLDESGEFANPGYGWEDRDFYMQMQEAGISQYVVGINSLIGKYYHTINSSWKNPGNMNHQQYVDTSLKRSKYFHKKWNDKLCLTR